MEIKNHILTELDKLAAKEEYSCVTINSDELIHLLYALGRSNRLNELTVYEQWTRLPRSHDSANEFHLHQASWSLEDNCKLSSKMSTYSGNDELGHLFPFMLKPQTFKTLKDAWLSAPFNRESGNGCVCSTYIIVYKNINIEFVASTD